MSRMSQPPRPSQPENKDVRVTAPPTSPVEKLLEVPAVAPGSTFGLFTLHESKDAERWSAGKLREICARGGKGIPYVVFVEDAGGGIQSNQNQMALATELNEQLSVTVVSKSPLKINFKTDCRVFQGLSDLLQSAHRLREYDLNENPQDSSFPLIAEVAALRAEGYSVRIATEQSSPELFSLHRHSVNFHSATRVMFWNNDHAEAQSSLALSYEAQALRFDLREDKIAKWWHSERMTSNPPVIIMNLGSSHAEFLTNRGVSLQGIFRPNVCEAERGNPVLNLRRQRISMPNQPMSTPSVAELKRAVLTEELSSLGSILFERTSRELEGSYMCALLADLLSDDTIGRWASSIATVNFDLQQRHKSLTRFCQSEPEINKRFLGIEREAHATWYVEALGSWWGTRVGWITWGLQSFFRKVAPATGTASP